MTNRVLMANQSIPWTSANAKCGSKPSVSVNVVTNRYLVCVDADEPSDAMMLKIAEVLKQDEFAADESI